MMISGWDCAALVAQPGVAVMRWRYSFASGSVVEVDVVSCGIAGGTMDTSGRHMVFTETPIPDVFIVDGDVFEDERGWFAPTWIAEPLAARGLDARAAQTSLAWNRERGTIRGLHYQSPPFEEVKVVRPLRGTVFDVAVDLRVDSPTFLKWFGVQLDWQSQRMLLHSSRVRARLSDVERRYTGVVCRFDEIHGVAPARHPLGRPGRERRVATRSANPDQPRDADSPTTRCLPRSRLDRRAVAVLRSGSTRGTPDPGP